MRDKRPTLEQGCRRIRHRGPDSEGYWEDEAAGLGLGHVRLAVQDVSAAGHQPMVSNCGRYVLVLNGEIYNHLALRRQLEREGCTAAWRGHSDTETILAAFAAWGVTATLQALTGMFAMALWDRQARVLTLMRDRLGEKPLYWGYTGGRLLFASELKAMTGLPDFDRELDQRALALLLRHNYIPAPYSIYRCIGKLPPGTLLVISEVDFHAGQRPAAQPYWRASGPLTDIESMLSFSNDTQAVDALESVLGQAVQGQLISDVSLGAFLSGGIDSSVVVSLMQQHNPNPVRTFSIGFDDPAYNEAEHAKAVARHLGTQHTELYVGANDALAVVPHLADIYDEPFADASQIPTSLVMRLARQHVTVALSGDGGDELFGGYSRYFRALSWWRRREGIPGMMRPSLALAARAGALLTPGGEVRDKLGKLSDVLSARHAGAFYRQFVSYWRDPASALLRADMPETLFDEPGGNDLFTRMLMLDAVTYLPDDILVKVDRAAMAVSLETRVPMLDHHVFEFARRLPQTYKVRDGKGKWLLRQLLYRHVPQEMVDRPKKGFSVPLANWLRGPLKDWGAALLDPARLQREEVFRPDWIQRKWQEHQAGKRDWSTHLWSVLMTQAWLERHGLGG